MKRLAIITTHPIQYNAPLFKLLAEKKEIEVKVFYTWEKAQGIKYDKGFEKQIDWDIPLLDGYNYIFVKNSSKKQDSHHFFRIKNPTLIKEIRDWQADALLVYGWNFYSHLKAMMYFKNKIPVYFRGDSTLLVQAGFLKKIVRKISLYFIYKNINYAFYVGENNKKYFIDSGLNEKQLIYAPHAIDNNRFGENDNLYSLEAQKWRNRLSISENDLVLLFAGKFEHRKNPQIIIEAAKKLQNEMNLNRKVYFIFAGNGKLENQLKEKSKDIPNILFLPFQNQSRMPILYRLADVFILPSESETWGLSVNEALACGIPVITSNKVGCAIDLIKNKENGYIFENNSIESLFNALIYFINNTEHPDKIKEKARESIKKWSFEECCNIMIRTIKNQ